MGMIVKETGGTNYPPIEAGTYPARCVGIIDLGIQHNNFNNKDQDRVRIVWELPDERIQTDEGEKPRWISKAYTKSLHEKAALRKDLDAWRGKPFTKDELEGFDLNNVLNAPCIITVVQQQSDNGNTYAKVSGVSRVMRGMTVPKLESEPFIFDMDGGAEADAVLETLPKWMQDEVKKSVTWAERGSKASPAEDQKFDDAYDDEDGELPF